MKEEEFKDLVQKSELKTSDRFMDDLMSKIEEKEVSEKSSIWSPRIVLPGVSLALFSLSFFLYKIVERSFSFPGLDLRISKTAFFVTAVFLFLLLINHTLKQTETFRNSKSIS